MHLTRACLAGLACLILAQTAVCEPAPSGRLRPWGRYLAEPSGHTTSVLPDGSVLIYGSGHPVHRGGGQAEQTVALRERGHFARPSPGPKLWDAARKGWRRLPPAPECPSAAHFMHTATVLNDGRVLMAGGLCDHPRLLDDPTPHRGHTALSLWDPAKRQWQAAPLLAEARIFHTASLMPDGRVLIVGGAVDPRLTQGTDAWVLSSAEHFSAGAVAPGAGLSQARAKHTATVLGDGRLLVVGGLGGDGRALASVEGWSPTTRAWQVLPPLRTARHSHAATRLSDGRVMVSGGVGVDGQALSSVELWDPRPQTWSDAAELPQALHGHVATQLTSGQVLTTGGTWVSHPGPIPWAWTWHPERPTWQVAGHILPGSLADLSRSSTHITVVARAAGDALVFTPDHILRWEPQVQDPRRTMPLWAAQPSATRLSDGRVMLIGRPERSGGTFDTIAGMWDPVGRLWMEVAPLDGRSRNRASTLQLPSGRVIHVSIDQDINLQCESWVLASQQWQSCGSIHVEHVGYGRVVLGLLPDGRAMAIASTGDVFVLDEQSLTWTAWQAHWSTQGMAYGAPIRTKEALLTVVDPASGKSIETNHAGARFWQGDTDGVLIPRLLWEPGQQRWAYLFIQQVMGVNAQWLPDGCAVSTSPLAVFNPQTGQARAIQDPGLGILPGQAEMVVLPDGTVIVTGVADGARDPGAGFFQGKVTCDGFEPGVVEHDFMSDVVVSDGPAAAGGAASAASSATSASVWQAPLRRLMPSRTGMVLIVGVALLGYALIKTSGLRRVGVGALALLIGLVAYWLHGRQPGSTHATPCHMVGVWSSRQGDRMMRIELKDDGTYVMDPSHTGAGRPGGYTGRWAVQGTRMVWQHDQGGSEDPDVNPILPESDTRFKLVEGNGRHTQYELIRAVPSAHCKP